MKKKIFEYLVFYLVNLITKHNIFLFPSLFSFYKIYDSMIIRTWCCGSVDSYSLNTNFRGWVLDFFQRIELFIEIQYPVNQCIDGINDYEFTYPWNSDFYWIDAFVCKWNHYLFCCPLFYHKHFSNYWHITYINVVILI